ncbi:MAG: helix-turn-helix domain-containing protein [Desulfurococcales archaeon]|nr:helix-turn-helix domain-containing protein [Desulfurococcales archaeon]
MAEHKLRLCHALSKEARRALVELARLGGGYSMRSLAKELGVTPPAVKKYVDGTTHPKDEVVCRLIDIVLSSAALRDEAKNIIVRDIVGVIESFLTYLMDRGLLSRTDLEELQRVVSKYRLGLLGTPRAT